MGGMVAMFFVMWFCGRIYDIPVWKIAVSAVLLTAIGYLGAKLMFFIESGGWSGRSLFGSIFLAPILMYPVTKVLRINYGKLLDICAPAECIMLALLKVKCVIDGCCAGRMVSFSGKSFVFPSQKVECAAFLIIMVILLVMIFKKKKESLIYPYYMIIYGVVRFILNLLRETTPWIGPLPAGNFWSICSIIIGLIALAYYKKHKMGDSKL